MQVTYVFDQGGEGGVGAAERPQQRVRAPPRQQGRLHQLVERRQQGAQLQGQSLLHPVLGGGGQGALAWRRTRTRTRAHNALTHKSRIAIHKH